MSDLFHEDVSPSFIMAVFKTMNEASHHTFQVLTKRPARGPKIAKTLTWSSNIWLGTSIESQRWQFRLEELKEICAHIKFLSIEPLLGPLPSIPIQGIDWVIVGGESGAGARPMDADWVREIQGICVREQAPFFFKQWGGVFKKRTGRTLDGRTWDQMPMGAELGRS